MYVVTCTFIKCTSISYNTQLIYKSNERIPRCVVPFTELPASALNSSETKAL